MNSFENWQGIRDVLSRATKIFQPPERLTVSEWADKYRVVSCSNAMPGPWRTDTAPYQREPMDCLGDRVTRRISLMWSAQVGKTELANNGIGFYIGLSPKSIMMMHPTQSDLKMWSETKLTPLLEETPVLSERVAKPRARDGVNNSLMKSFPGGFLMFAWSGSSNTMRGRSAPVIFCDEIDGYSMTDEGDAVQLLWQRAATFGDQRKLFESSTPTIKGYSPIEKAFEAGDMRRYFVPCPHCGMFQTLKWGQVRWDKDEQGEAQIETAHYVCEECGAVLSDADKPGMLRLGEWRAEKPFRGHASFHLNELYSPWRRFSDVVQSFLDKKHAGDSKSFVNVSLAETWEEDGVQVSEAGLLARCESYAAPVPAGGLFLTAGVDTQPDRLEVEVVAWGSGEECWSIDYRILYGDPDQPEVWQELDDYLERRWIHESGAELTVQATCIDSGGSNTQAVYGYCARRWGIRRWAIKGVGGENVPLVSAAKKQKIGKQRRPCRYFSLGVNQGKSLVYRRLALEGDGPGRCHFPASYAERFEYFSQLTAEKCITRYVKGFPKREWIKTRRRNEALDCRVYAYCAFVIAQPNLSKLKNRLIPAKGEAEASQSAVVEPAQKEAKSRKRKTKKRRRRSRSNFVLG